MKRVLLSLLAGASAFAVGWRCLRGQHPETKLQRTFCPTCERPMDKEKYGRFLRGVGTRRAG
jgi:hypothetical protein